MGKFLSCGKINRYFIYILLSALFDIAKDCLLEGLNHDEAFEVVKLYSNDDAQNKLSKHYYIHNIFNYLGTILFSFIFYKIENSCSKTKSSALVNNTNNNQNSRIILIHNNSNIEDFQTVKAFFIFLFIILIWVLEEQILKLYMVVLQDLDFWMVEIIIISLFTLKMFKVEIFRHQIIAMLINIIPCLLKIGSIILSFYDDTDDNQNYTGKLPVIYVKDSFIIIPLGVIIYLILIFLRSFVNSKIKWYMDLKYISSNRLLFYYGIIGAFILTIFSIVSTFKKCTFENIRLDNKTVNYYDYICRVQDINNNTIFNNRSDNIQENITYSNITYYLEHFNLYLDILDKKNILKEFSIIILGMITFFFNKFFSILVIKYLTPVHITFSVPILYIIQKLFMIVNTLIWDKKLFKSDDKFKHIKVLLDIIGDIFSLLGFLIYLEIIVLNFCKIDYNIKENIAKRSFMESYGINKKGINEDGINNDNEEKSFASEEDEQEDDNIDLIYNNNNNNNNYN